MLRDAAKAIVLGVGFVAASPLIVATWLEAWAFRRKSERIYGGCGELLSLLPSILGSYVRLAYYVATCTGVSWRSQLAFGATLAHREVTIGPGAVIGAQSIIGYADIGARALLGPRVSIISGRYQHGRPQDRVSGAAIGVYTRVRVGEDAWIGQGAIVMADVGSHCTVSAGSVVMRACADGTTVLGFPARRVNLDPNQGESS